MSRSYKVKVQHTTESGQKLRVEYISTFYPGFISGPPEACYPDETDDTDPDFYIDGKWVKWEDIPADLEDLFDEMTLNSAEDDERFEFEKKEYDPRYD